MTSRRYTFSVKTGEKKFDDVHFRLYQRFENGGAIYTVLLGETVLGTASWQGNVWQGWDATSYKDFDKMTEEQYNSIAKYGVKKPDTFRVQDFMRTAEDFKTRRAAAAYLVRHWGFNDEYLKKTFDYL